MNPQFGLFLGIVSLEKARHIGRLIVHSLVAILLTFFITNISKNTGPSQSNGIFGNYLIRQDDLPDNFPGELVNKIYFTPQNEFTEKLMEAVRQQLYIVDERVVPYASDTAMEFALLDNSYICFGVSFQNITDDGQLAYVIRTKNNNFRTSAVYSQDVYSSYRKESNEYVDSGFLALQNAVDLSYVAMVKAKLKMPNGGERPLHIAYGHIPVDDKRGPQEPARNVELIPALAVLFVIIDIFALLLPMVEERASGMREYLKIATSSSCFKEMALFVINFVQLCTILIVCFAIAFFKDYWDTNPAMIVYHVILAILFVINLITFTFFLSTTLESATMATAVAPIIFFGPLFLSIVSKGLVMPLCLFPVVGFCYAGLIGEAFKASGHLFLAHNLFTVDYPGVGYVSMFHVYVCQLLGMVLWLFLWFYVSNVFPGRYGTPQDKEFFLRKSYWKQSPGGVTNRPRNTNKITAESQHDLRQDSTGSNELDKHFETISMAYIDEGPDRFGVDLEQPRKEMPVPGSQLVVRISNLNKVFKGRTGAKMVVQNFSLSIYSHSITVLLGHNGAGKTTTMNIITGILPPTSGTVEVDGEDNPHRYRQKIGFCPQHNVFFSYLNCREHLEYFGRLRGLNASAARAEANIMLEKVNLLDKSESLVRSLSGGMKRRLSLAIAIMGHTKLLILDEPTSGLDPESRRDIWDILLKLRQNHTILLTTHFMEEADVLGDWVAIMDDGELVAFGTPLTLKQKYGKGYTLKLFKSHNFNEKGTWSLIQRYVPKAAVRDSVREIFAATLPYHEITQYAALLKELKENQHVLGIESVSMANATLEEVFLNSSNRKKEIQHHAESVDRVDSPPHPLTLDGPSMSTESKTTLRLAINVCKAIWRKKWIHMKSNKHIFGFLFSLPLLVITCCFLFTTGIADAAKSLPAVYLAANTIQQARGIFVINRDSDSNEAFGNLQTMQADFDRSPVNGVRMAVVMQENGVSLQDVLQEKIVQDYTAYRDQLVVGIECNITNNGTYLTVLYNNNLVHSTGIAESVLATLLLRYFAGTPEAVVRTENIPSTRRQLIDIQTPFYVTELLPIASMVCLMMYLSEPLHEHLTGFRQMHNVNRYLYWGSTYMCDLLVHFIQCDVVIALMFLLDHTQAFSESSKFNIFWILYVYGWVALPVIYIISQCVQSVNTAITIMSYLMITGVAFVFMLSNGYDDIVNNEPWITMLHVVPEFGLKHSMRVVYENQKLTIYEQISIQQNRGHSALVPSANKRLSLHTFYIMALVVLVVLVIILNEVVENIHRLEKVKIGRESANANIRKMCRRFSRSTFLEHGRARAISDVQGRNADDGRDETDGPALPDVDKQTELVDRLVEDTGEGASGEYAIIVKALKKSYGDREAVKSVSFAVKKGECFGLLGMNGAGKTTIFEMLSGNLPASEGEIYLQSFEVRKANAMEYRHQYGYCPQFDALLYFMTVHELINYFAQLKGLNMREKLINNWLVKLDILQYRDHTLDECSGGTKRKVNTILALLGGPSVVLLDEPTTGVDPKSRHFLWKTIKAIQRKDQTVLLTSHSMDECEELCNRLSIMVDGRLRCVGTIPELKQRHGQGYNLWIKLKITQVESANEANENEQLIHEVKERFQATLQEEHMGLLKFVVDVQLELSDLFDRVIELESKRGNQIETYSINETSLEDIFLFFRPKKRRNI